MRRGGGIRVLYVMVMNNRRVQKIIKLLPLQ